MVFAAVAFGVMFPAASGASKGNLHLDYTSSSTNGSMPHLRFTQTTSPCQPLTKRAISGGVDTTGGFGQEALVYSLPSTDDMVHFGSWQAGYDNLGTVSGDYLTAGAICGDLSGFASVIKSVNSNGSTRATAKSRCPKGTHAVGGGGYTTAGFGEQRLVDSAPFDSGDAGKQPDDGWRVTGDNVAPGSSTPQHLLAYAQCAPLGGLEYVSEQFNVKSGSRGKRSAKCPKGEWVLGGGVSQDGAMAKELLVTTLFDSSTDKAWRARLDNLGGKKIQARAYAICHA